MKSMPAYLHCRQVNDAPTHAKPTREILAYLVRHKTMTAPARLAFDGKDHYGEWSEWRPETVAYAKAVTDPTRNYFGSDTIYESLPLVAVPPQESAQ